MQFYFYLLLPIILLFFSFLLPHIGDVICTQGDEGQYFYIIKEGDAICSQIDATGEDKVNSLI